MTASTLKAAILYIALCDLKWKDFFPNASLRHLPRTQSDHAPLFLKLNSRDINRRCGPFRMQAAWYLHDDFKPFIDREWNDLVGLEDNVKHMADILP